MISATQIKEHMEVVGSDGMHVGTVDYMDGSDRIMLTESDSADHLHHTIPIDWVESVDSKVHLTRSGEEVVSQIAAS